MMKKCGFKNVLFSSFFFVLIKENRKTKKTKKKKKRKQRKEPKENKE